MEIKNIREDIESNTFSSLYLIYGEEDFLRNSYKNKLSDAIVPPGDNLNRTCFSGKGPDTGEIISLSDTLPFMSEKRLIIIEDSGFFKNGADDGFVEYLSRIPEETVIIFSESEVEKNRKIYKAVDKAGKILKCDRQKEDTLIKWIAFYLKGSGKKISGRDAELLLLRTGDDMYLIKNELDKLISYTEGRDEISADDIRESGSVNLRSSIFAMIDDIAEGRQKKALERYYDLVLLREAPLRILYLLSREFNMLLLAKDLSKKGSSQGEMASAMKVPPFAVKKYLSASGHFSRELILSAIEECIGTEDDIKKGKVNDKLGTEMLIVKYSDPSLRSGK